MGMIKKIKQLFCSHNYILAGKDYNCGCLLKEYYRCTKCGKVKCIGWKYGNDD